MKRTRDSQRAWERRTRETAWRKKREKFFAIHSNRPAPKARKPLKKVSKSQARRLVVYQRVRIEFLALPQNATCKICKVRNDAGILVGINMATEVHHKAGRHGKNLIDTSTFIPSCRACREWPHDNAKLARQLGLLV